MNISMTGNNSQEVQELVSILRNAGLDSAHAVSAMDLNPAMPMSEPTPCSTCGGSHNMDTPCGENVEEEWDNSPEEEYQDHDYMMKDLSGGINRKKPIQAQRVKDPAVAYETKLKYTLKNNLLEMYKKISEQDPFAELDRAIDSPMQDMEADLERQHRLAREKMKKQRSKKMEAGEKYATMSPQQADIIKQRMKQATGTGTGNKRLANNPPTAMNKAQAPDFRADGSQKKAKTMKIGTAAAPAQGINPVTASLAAKAFPGFINKGGTVQQVVDFWIGKGVPHNQLADFFRAKIQKQQVQ